MHGISFSKSWGGRLFMDNFSDVRLPDAEKFFVGNELKVFLKNTEMGTVSIAALREFEFRKITDVLSHLICGHPAHYLAAVLKKFYPDENIQPETKFVHMVLHYTERHFENQTVLITEWWRDKQIKIA